MPKIVLLIIKLFLILRIRQKIATGSNNILYLFNKADATYLNVQFSYQILYTEDLTADYKAISE